VGAQCRICCPHLYPSSERPRRTYCPPAHPRPCIARSSSRDRIARVRRFKRPRRRAVFSMAMGAGVAQGAATTLLVTTTNMLAVTMHVGT
jgi:hypothetical protein